MLLSIRRKMLLLDNSLLCVICKRQSKAKRMPTNKIFLKREIKEEFHHMYKDLRRDGNESLFYGYARMLPETFDYIAKLIKPEIKHRTTNFQQPISVEERLMLTIR